MKKTASSMDTSITDKNIDQFCSSIEKLLTNIKSKRSKPRTYDNRHDQNMLDNEMDDRLFDF
ncbi:MAG: hypothetical protein JSW20_05540 [Nitrospiraceae bacterium]|nr:MAG: hypothetical protein JSW20_05540 [Nitrospiraceae bacterium]